MGKSPLRAELLEYFMEHLNESDWKEGIDLEDSKRVRQLEVYNRSLLTVKVDSGDRLPHQVSMKLHPSGKFIQYLECSCAKYRVHKEYCEHIAAGLVRIDKVHPSIFDGLDMRNPLKSAKPKSRTPKAASGEKEESLNSLLLEKMESGIRKVTWMKKTSKLRVKLEVRPGTQTWYDLDTDAAAEFMSKPSAVRYLSKDLENLIVGETPVELGFLARESGPEQIVLERVVAMTPAPDAGGGKFHEMSSVALGQESGAVQSRFYPMKSMTKHVGKRWVFLPELGWFPVDRNVISPSWSDAPFSKTFKNDEAAEVLDNGFSQARELGKVWVEESLSKRTVALSAKLEDIAVIESGKGWFHLDPRYGMGDGRISMSDMMRHFSQNKRKYLKTDSGWVKIPEFITEHEWELDPTQQFLRVDTLGMLRIKAASGGFDSFSGSKEALSEIRSKMEFQESSPAPKARSPLNLRPYQQQGYEWLWWLHQNSLHGLLADDMGLGKTHQAMALMTGLLSQKSEGSPSHFLVVCPTTVLEHWFDKVQEFAPTLQPIIFHGPQRRKQLEKAGSSPTTIITSYGVLIRDMKALGAFEWDAVILDEAHFVKNNKTATYKAACKLKSSMRICLSGTPMENHLGEIKNIFDFLLPGYLGSDKYFKKHFMTPIEKSENDDREVELQKLIHPFKLRRTKNQVLEDLPEKIEDVRRCKLSAEQIRMYRDILNLRGAPLLEQLKDNHTPVPFLHVFSLLQMLKQICNHPVLLGGGKYTEHESGKFDSFKEILFEALESGHKVVVFSQYVGMIKIFEQYLQDEGISYVSLTGQSRNRGRLIDSFQKDSDVKVFLGSLLAGGIGIDLTAASVVIHYDRWWNASKENQATDRVHRIGQKKGVQVFKMMTEGTLEERIDQMISSKHSMFERFLEKDEEIFKNLSRNDLIELLQ